MNRTTIERGDRIRAGKIYGTATLVAPAGTVWFQPDAGGSTRCVKPQHGEPIERVHGLKHRSAP